MPMSSPIDRRGVPEFPTSAPETPAALMGFPNVSKMQSIFEAPAQVILAGFIVLSGCDANVDSIDHESAQTTGGDTHTDAQSAGETEPAPVDPATYPNCLWDLVPNPPPGEGSACPGDGGYGGGGGFGFCTFCVCHEPCNTDDDCAAPPGVTAQGQCTEDGMCFLHCDGGKTCPDGMTCVDDEHGDICVWATADEFFCAEVVGGPGDPCGEITDASTCNATVSELTSERCLWVEESIVATGAGTCEEAVTQGRCVWVQETEACDETEVCPSGEARVRWRDLGAGTVAVAAFDCSVQPHGAEGYESCDFGGGTAIPLVCACGCD